LPLIREAGIGLSIDDYGTGYSSLAILADITADELKVDRSLIESIPHRPRNQGICAPSNRSARTRA
jgi:EAL domain-containing protein (putative c-di-GMP-specific phosphodiesterase class I)